MADLSIASMFGAPLRRVDANRNGDAAAAKVGRVRGIDGHHGAEKGAIHGYTSFLQFTHVTNSSPSWSPPNSKSEDTTDVSNCEGACG